MLAKTLRKLWVRGTADTDYRARVSQQVAQYATERIHDVPPIYDYWADTHIRPRSNSVFGVDTMLDFYAEHVRQRAAHTSPTVARILSLGAGDAELEVQIARELLSGGLGTFCMECLELSPILIDRANQRIQAAGLSEHVTMLRSDLNAWPQAEPPAAYTAVIANHILHHVVELETLFANVAAAIGQAGVFLTAEMIGRNGHMRWPEALTLVNALWDTLPEELRYNHVFHETDRVFRNWDCSSAGFEGIRAQDILPLLTRRFQFEKFLAFGNLPDQFVDRFYGPNFDPSVPAHTRFVDSVEQLNSLLLELGVLKPTKMLAVMSNHSTSPTRIWKNLSPQFCVRDPENQDLAPSRQASQLLANVRRPITWSFRQGDAGERCLRAGWSYPEEWGTWMVGSEAVLEVAIPAALKNAPKLTLRIGASAFIPGRFHARSFSIMAGDMLVGGVTFWRSEKIPKRFDLEMDKPASDVLLLRIVAHEKASPAEDGSDDGRFLGLALIDIALY